MWVLVLAGLLAVGSAPAPAQGDQTQPARSGPLTPEDVDVLIGTGGSGPWRSGNTSPAAGRPFGMVHLGPDTTSDPGGSPSGGASGFHADDTLVRGFSATHLSGAGCATFGDVPVLPVLGELPGDPSTATVPRGTEAAGPGWFETLLGNQVRARMSTTARTGLLELTFPRGTGRPALLVKGAGSLAGSTASRVRFVSPTEVVVTTTSGGFCGQPGSYDVHVALRLDRPLRGRGRWGGSHAGAWLRPTPDARGRVQVQIGVSFVDAAGAWRNLDSEAPGWSYRRLRAAAGSEWSSELQRLAVEGGTATDRLLLGSALHRVLQSPMTLSDADGRYPGFDGRVHRVAPGRRVYTAISGWDAYRTHVPLLAWLRPDVASDVVRSLLLAGRQGGWLPRWPLVAHDTGVMNGDAAAPVAAAAWAYGARDLPLPDLVEALRRQAEDPAVGAGRARPGLEDYLRLGWVPTVPGGGRPWAQGASTTLEYAAADFALHELASAAGRPEVARRALARAGSWHHLVDRDTGWLAPRAADGSWVPHDPAGCCTGFEEGSAVQYTWGSVLHDRAGLLAALGSRDRVLARLSDFFGDLDAGAGGRAWIGNQPSFASPWAYLWLGRPDLAQDVVDRIRAQWSPEPAGLPGNDDLGASSAWFVWMSLGLQPLVPGTAVTAVGVPAFDRIEVRPHGGARTVLVRTGDGARVSGVRVDGQDLGTTWTTWETGHRPREVVVTTTDEPRPAWGTAPDDRPPSWPAGPAAVTP